MGILIVIISPSVAVFPVLNVHFAGTYLFVYPEPLSCAAVPVPVESSERSFPVILPFVVVKSPVEGFI
jgi:hypothetical protein